jgi:beta-glucosidase
MERIDDAVAASCALNFRWELFSTGKADAKRSSLADRGPHNAFGSEGHRAVARECVHASLVLLTNEGGVLQLPKNAAHIHVAAKSADDLGNPCGG